MAPQTLPCSIRKMKYAFYNTDSPKYSSFPLLTECIPYTQLADAIIEITKKTDVKLDIFKAISPKRNHLRLNMKTNDIG